MLINLFVSTLRNIDAGVLDRVSGLAFSPNGLYLATILWDSICVGFLVCFTLIILNYS